MLNRSRSIVCYIQAKLARFSAAHNRHAWQSPKFSIPWFLPTMLSRYLSVLLSVRIALGAIYTSFAQLPTELNFDFIVVGGGGAGNVVANRLTENPAFSVLVLEAGPLPEGLNYSVPFFQFSLRHPNPRDWNYTTAPLTGISNQVQQYPRGRVLGGCTSMNGMQYVRGSNSDYDRYARVTGDPGWSWDSMLHYLKKSEHWTPPTDGHKTTGQFDPAVHGFNGLVGVSLSGSPLGLSEFVPRSLQVTRELPDQFPFNLDYNSGTPIGVGTTTFLPTVLLIHLLCWRGWTQTTIKNGKRSNSYTSYLAPEFIARPNLHVLLNSQVTRIIQTSQSPKKFMTVEFAENREGLRHRLTASKEVVISAGALETPKLLLNSGIGDGTALRSFGIQTLVDLPDVGKNLSVQVGFSVDFFTNSTDTTDSIYLNETLQNMLLDEWIATDGGGVLGWSGSTQLSHWNRLPDSLFETFPDPSSGPDSPHCGAGPSNGLSSATSSGAHFIAAMASLATPTSRGTISLNTTDPFDQPIIDLACLTTDFDIAAVREAMKLSLLFLSTPAWDGYILGPANNITNATSDADLEAYARAHSAPNGHVVGTASMSPRGADWGVVDPDLLVKGVAQLRIVDASILPYVPAANTQAAVYALAERASDLIKAKWA
ncbi:Aryl-alcohol-oxidase from pleurotus Eryingii [Mycena sanguinolenta]|uniref:Aryl-alcohol-oxidase from pleurotus Eryingii n=1 Tax=Mycena sanguinolenta TaxID=230812 RepID=A0A8H6XQB5_9AGAR|nr:Aryl-alcohol-oxidase from pleurotus Eryingii [Mycena sanguinolenta]